MKDLSNYSRNTDQSRNILCIKMGLFPIPTRISTKTSLLLSESLSFRWYFTILKLKFNLSSTVRFDTLQLERGRLCMRRLRDQFLEQPPQRRRAPEINKDSIRSGLLIGRTVCLKWPMPSAPYFCVLHFYSSFATQLEVKYFNNTLWQGQVFGLFICQQFDLILFSEFRPHCFT